MKRPGAAKAADAKSKTKPTAGLDYRAQVVKIYEEHNPEKIGMVAKLMKTYDGREAELIEKLKSKYGIGALAEEEAEAQPETAEAEADAAEDTTGNETAEAPTLKAPGSALKTPGSALKAPGLKAPRKSGIKSPK